MRNSNVNIIGDHLNLVEDMHTFCHNSIFDHFILIIIIILFTEKDKKMMMMIKK